MRNLQNLETTRANQTCDHTQLLRWQTPFGMMDSATTRETLSKLNDDARQSLFDAARTDIPPSNTLLHEIVKTPTECLVLSVAVDELSSDKKERLFQACKTIPESDQWESNTFNYACDPEGYHEMASIKVDGIPECYIAVNYLRSYEDARYPEDLTNCVRVFTLMLTDEY